MAVSSELTTRLRAATADRRWIHHVDCAVYSPDGERADCTCDIPDLLTDLAALLTPAAVTGPARSGRP